VDCTPGILGPRPRTVTIKIARPDLWSPTNAGGSFCI
jgi:hypothetical protein